MFVHVRTDLLRLEATTKIGEFTTGNRQAFLHSDRDDKNESGVGLFLAKETRKSLID